MITNEMWTCKFCSNENAIHRTYCSECLCDHNSSQSDVSPFIVKINILNQQKLIMFFRIYLLTILQPQESEILKKIFYKKDILHNHL